MIAAFFALVLVDGSNVMELREKAGFDDFWWLESWYDGFWDNEHLLVAHVGGEIEYYDDGHPAV